MKSITLENFRCFRATRRIPLRPLTLLIGENSTGKTSFLAAVRLASDLLYPGLTPDFNEPPFRLGSFNEVAHHGRGTAGRAQSFSITVNTPVRTSSSQPALRHRAVFRRSGPHPVFASQSILYGSEFEVELTPIAAREGELPIECRVDDSRYTVVVTNPSPGFTADRVVDWHHVLFLALNDSAPGPQDYEGDFRDRRRTLLNAVQHAITAASSPDRPVCIAPVRTTPRRTYDPVSAAPVPEGAHIPMVLANLFFHGNAEWKSLKNALDRFGKESGLFADLNVKALGRHDSDPFQIRVKIHGPQVNLLDVGYGVSQALPILVEALRSAPGSMHLMQQPEVHMHPRSQAALGSFLANLAANQQKQFIVETHSDHLVDRVRMDIRDGRSLCPQDVVLLYFERNGPRVDIHPIDIDQAGSLVGEPDTYREFFLTEERRLLGM